MMRCLGLFLIVSAVTSCDISSSAAQDSTRPQDKTATSGSTDELMGFINDQIRQGWTDNVIKPSAVADDGEWLRRISLDVVGHIPPIDVVEKFLADKDSAKRTKQIEILLDDPAYVRNWTTLWTNLMIGRSPPRRTSRSGMQKFLREAFAKNRPWNEIVYNVVSAQGHFEREGAVNYLLAQITGNNP